MFVFIHGFGGQAEQWHYQMQKFAVENRVIALDLRGHGLSDKPRNGYEMPQILEDLEAALTLLKVKGKIVLVENPSAALGGRDILGRNLTGWEDWELWLQRGRSKV